MANPRVVSNPKVMLGKPVIEGTRITVEFVLESMAAGEAMGEILNAHPTLTREGILAALDFAARQLKNEVVYPLEGKAA